MVWTVPQQEAEQMLAARLRELRAHTRQCERSPPGSAQARASRTARVLWAIWSTWVGVLRRLQSIIDQANLKYRAAEVFTLSC